MVYTGSFGLFVTVLAAFLVSADPASAARELTGAQLKYLLNDSNWDISKTCGISSRGSWDGTIRFSTDGTFRGNTLCAGGYSRTQSEIEGNWLIEEDTVCFENTKISAEVVEFGVTEKLFEAGTCREIIVERFGFQMRYPEGKNDWFMRLVKHPEHSDRKKLTEAVKQIKKDQQLAARAPSVSEVASDSAMWEEIKFSSRISDFQRYLEKHPNGLFIELAENQIRDLIKRQSQGGGIGDQYANIHFGRYHALVIGIDDYKHLPKLDTATKDATAISKMLSTDYGFEVRTLINPTRGDILDAFDDYLQALNSDDNLLIYYAGHGWLDEVTDRGYWLPVDAQEGRRARWLSNADITDTLKSLSAKHVMVVADSCYSGTLTRSAVVGIRDANYYQRIASKRARVAMVSGGLEPVADDTGSGNSPFATAFLNALRDNPDVIDGTRLFGAIRRPVILHAQQTPEYSDVRNSGHDGGDFLFVRNK